MVDDNNWLDIYRIDTKDKIDKKKIAILLICIIVIIELFFTTRYVMEAINSYKVYKQYENQLELIKNEEARIAAEQERKRQEKIPKLTEERNK